MAYQLKGTWYGPCSCNIGCPCLLGELEADRGYCSAVGVFDIKSGKVDNVDVSGTRAALIADWPKGFLQGNGTARFYFDTAVSKEQEAALTPVLAGKRGGIFEAFASLIPNVLGIERAAIKVTGDTTSGKVTVGDVAGFDFGALKGSSGELTRVLHGAATFRDNVVLGKSKTWSKAAGLKDWKNEGGHIETTEFDMSGN